MKSKISCWRFVRSLPMSTEEASSDRRHGGLIEWSEHVFVNVSPPLDGLKRGPPQGYTRPRPRADGGIGRRARLRAWSGITGWRFESSSAHSEKPRPAGLFAFSGSIPAVGGDFLSQSPLTPGPHPCGPALWPTTRGVRSNEHRLRARAAALPRSPRRERTAASSARLYSSRAAPTEPVRWRR